MSVPVEVPIVAFIANGVNRTFDFDFPLPLVSEGLSVLDVYLGTDQTARLVDPTDYTVSYNASGRGGSVTFREAPAAGLIVSLVRNTTKEQPYSFQNGVSFLASDVMGMGDRIVYILQEFGETLDRSIKLPPGSDQTPEEFLNNVYDASDQALQSRNEAVAAATRAKTSETNAKTSETNSKTSEVNAQASATTASEASQAATEAKDYIISINPLNWKGAWSATVRYTKGDVVYYDGSSWRCIPGYSYNQIPAVGNKDWEPIALKGSPAPALMPVVFNVIEGNTSHSTMGVNGFSRVSILEKDSDLALSSSTTFELSVLKDSSIPAIQVPNSPATVSFPESFRGKAITVTCVNPPTGALYVGITLKFEE